MLYNNFQYKFRIVELSVEAFVEERVEDMSMNGEELITNTEKLLSKDGSFCEGKIKANLRMRVVSKEYYIRNLMMMREKTKNVLEDAHKERAWDSEFISRCKECESQASKLLSMVVSL